VFAVMLAEPEEPARTETSGATLAWGGLAFAIAGSLFAGLFWLGYRGQWSAQVGPVGDGSIAAIGRALLTTYSMAFELISVALLVAILGALAIARAGRTRPGSIAPEEAVSSKLVTEPPPAVTITTGALDHDTVVSGSRDLVAP